LFVANPASTTVGPVVAVSVCGVVRDSFQTAVFRSRVKRAPGADVIWFGTVKVNVTEKMDESTSGPSGSPGDGDARGCGCVVKVYVSFCPDVL
jgi:hypothetical protein